MSSQDIREFSNHIYFRALETQPIIPRFLPTSAENAPVRVALNTLNNAAHLGATVQPVQNAAAVNRFKNWTRIPSQGETPPVMQSPDKRFEYMGSWAEDMPQGYGQLHNGKSICQGIWENGKQHGEFEITEIATGNKASVIFNHGILQAKNLTLKKGGVLSFAIHTQENGTVFSKLSCEDGWKEVDKQTAEKKTLKRPHHPKLTYNARMEKIDEQKLAKNNQHERNSPGESQSAPNGGALMSKNDLTPRYVPCINQELPPSDLVFDMVHCGGRYSGAVVNNQPHGLGALVFSDGRRYWGNFIAGMAAQIMTCNHQNGDMYTGEINANWEPHGKGFYSGNGFTYQGPWVSGKQHGKGIIINDSGGHYDAEFDMGQIIELKPYVFEPIILQEAIVPDTFKVASQPHFPRPQTTQEYQNELESNAMAMDFIGSFQDEERPIAMTETSVDDAFLHAMESDDIPSHDEALLKAISDPNLDGSFFKLLEEAIQ